MKQSKKTRKLSIGQIKVKENKWKSKAISRRKENDRLKKRLKEVTASRDNWKWKWKWKNRHESGDLTKIVSGEKASRHRYSLDMNVLVVALNKYGGMSLRSCRHCLCCIFVCLGLRVNPPSHSTIRIWLCKCGMYRVEKEQGKSGKYVVFVDESISFGSEKILLILGVCVENIEWGRSLSHEDMEVLYVGVSQEWKSEDIEAELSKIAQYHTIEYIVSDEGNNLRKAYKILYYKHIEDCTHIFANALKRIYDKDELFEQFRKLIGSLRQAWNLSKTKSQYMPPSMRGKMRFANIFPCVNWAEQMLQNWDYLEAEVQTKLVFLQEQKEFIETLIQIAQIFKMVCSKLKNSGFSLTQKQEILKELEGIDAQENTAIFIGNCKDYLENLTEKSKQLEIEQLLCSSDIIESYFGKFKNKMNRNSRKGLTEFIFTIATFGKPYSKEEAKKALESIRKQDLVLNKRMPRICAKS
jgi:hypothetical protein